MTDLQKMFGGLRCSDLLSLLTDYVAGELGTTEIGQVNAHLQGCAYCEKFGREYGELVGELHRHVEAPALNVEVQARLTRRMEAVWAGEGE